MVFPCAKLSALSPECDTTPPHPRRSRLRAVTGPAHGGVAAHLLEDIAPAGAPAHNGVGGRLPVDAGLRVDGEDALLVHPQQLLLHQAGLSGQGLVIPGQAGDLQRGNWAGVTIGSGTLGPSLSRAIRDPACLCLCKPLQAPRWGSPSLSPSPFAEVPHAGQRGKAHRETGPGV